MEPKEEYVEQPDGIRAWTCSLCGIVQRLESDPCRSCSHPRDQAPASDDIVIQNWHPNEGEDDGEDDGEDANEEQLEGMYEAPEAAVEIDNLRVEGEAQNLESDFSSSDEDDWDGTELVDADAAPSIEKLIHEPPPEIEGPKGSESGWLCSFCNHENSLLDIECTGCRHVRSMGDDADDIIMLRPEITAGRKPNAIPDEKDMAERFEVWQCAFCSSYNDFTGELLPCWCCSKRVDTTVGGFITFDMEKEEYENCVTKPKEPKQRAGAGGGGGGAAPRPFGGSGAGGAFGSWKAPDRPHVPKPYAVGNLRSYDDAFINIPQIVRKHCSREQYPTRADPAFKDPNRLGQVLGLPSALPNFRMTKLYWRDGVICYPCCRVQEAIEDIGPDQKNGLYDRGFAVNEDGWLAVLTRRRLRLYQPRGPSFAFLCEVDFPFAPASQPHQVRVRFRDAMIYVFLNYTVYRYEVVGEQLVARQNFGDDYMQEQSFQDIDVDDAYLIACWRKWAGLYTRDNFKWFHAVSTSTVLVKPSALAYRHNYLHVNMSGCIFAFHAASRDPSVLWINGNLPKDEKGVSFCVSDTYGVFTAVNGDIVQSYYDAPNALSIYKDDCKTGNRSVTPSAKRITRERHFVHDRLAVGEDSPFENVSHIEYDSSFGQNGRLLCWDQEASVLFMCLPRLEFDQLTALFRMVFGLLSALDQHPVERQEAEPESPIRFLGPDEIEKLSPGDRVDFRSPDGKFYAAEIRARGGNEFMILRMEGADPDTQRIVDVASYIGKFAQEGALSGREAHRLEEICVGSEVEVNLENVGWSTATVVESSVSQVQVQLGNGEVKWTHLDFVDEIREKKNLIAEAIAYADKPTEGAENLSENLSPAQREEIETKFAEAAAKYSEVVVKFALLKSLGLDVSSSPDGLRVTHV